MHPDRYALVQDPGNGAQILLLATSDNLDHLTRIASQFGPFRVSNHLNQGFPVSWAPPTAVVRRQFFRESGGVAGLGALYEGGTGRSWEILDMEHVTTIGRRRWIEYLISHGLQYLSPEVQALVDQNHGGTQAALHPDVDGATISDVEAEALAR